MTDELVPTDTLPTDPVREVDHPEFPVVLRGYDRDAVDAYVERVVRLVDEMEATRSPRSAVRAALARVGEETADILSRAHETAEQLSSEARVEAERLTASSRAEAERLTRTSQTEADARRADAEREAEELVAAARRRLADLDRDADLVWQERARILADVQRLSAELGRVVDTAMERFPPGGDPGETVEMDSAELSELLDGPDAAA